MRDLYLSVEVDEPESTGDLSPDLEDDLEVAGWYLLQVDDDLSDTQAADAAMDRFAESIPLHVPDNARLTVYTVDGDVIVGDDDHDSGSLADEASDPDRIDAPEWAEE